MVRVYFLPLSPSTPEKVSRVDIAPPAPSPNAEKRVLTSLQSFKNGVYAICVGDGVVCVFGVDVAEKGDVLARCFRR